VTHEGARGSRTYAVTDAGRDELRTWLFTPPRQSKVRNELVLRMFLLSALEPADARKLLGRIAANTAQEAAELRRLRTEAGPVRLGPRGSGSSRRSTACVSTRRCTTGRCGPSTSSTRPIRR
jgi:hypothetical protein